MDLLFKKQNSNSLWIAGIGVVAAAAGALAWFFLRNREPEPSNENTVPEYLNDRFSNKRKPKSDVEQLHTITPAATEE